MHYLIIGFGVVSVAKPQGQTAVLATKTQALGISLSDQPGTKLGIGYSAGSFVAIPANAEDVRVEISQQVGGPLTVESAKNVLKNNRTPGD